MKYIITLLLALSCFGIDHLQTYNDQLINLVEKIDNEHERQIEKAVKDHLIKLNKLQIHYTKKGDLEKALKVKEAIKALSIDKAKESLVNTKWVFQHNKVVIVLLKSGYVQGTPGKKWRINEKLNTVQIGDFHYQRHGKKLINDKFSLKFIGKF